jgi:hypothetical protein
MRKSNAEVAASSVKEYQYFYKLVDEPDKKRRQRIDGHEQTSTSLCKTHLRISTDPEHISWQTPSEKTASAMDCGLSVLCILIPYSADNAPSSIRAYLHWMTNWISSSTAGSLLLAVEGMNDRRNSRSCCSKFCTANGESKVRRE